MLKNPVCKIFSIVLLSSLMMVGFGCVQPKVYAAAYPYWEKGRSKSAAPNTNQTPQQNRGGVNNQPPNYRGQPAPNNLYNPPNPNYQYNQNNVAQTPSENLFLNTVWGGMAGGILGMSVMALDFGTDKSERYEWVNMRQGLSAGMAAGALVGFASAIALSVNNVQQKRPDIIDKLNAQNDRFIPNIQSTDRPLGQQVVANFHWSF